MTAAGEWAEDGVVALLTIPSNKKPASSGFFI
jgi:hypothetical protein